MPKKKSRHGEEYTAAEVRTIRQCAKARMSARVTAAKIGRSPGALRYAAMVRGISFRSINRRAA